MSYQSEIAKILTEVLVNQMAIPADQVAGLESWVEVPKQKENGDFAFPCFRLARVLRKKPVEIATDIFTHLEAVISSSENIASVNAMGPYLNFKVNKAALAASLIPGILDGDFLARRPDKNTKVMVEYSQPNTHKAFHVGHTRNVALGDALWRIYDWNGYETVPVNYIGDEGTHIAKCLWYYINHFTGETPETNLGEFLGSLYTAAGELLDFKLLTKCPMPNLMTARVTSVAEIAGNEKLKVVKVDTGADTYQVVCGGIGYAEGDVVAYAPLGSKVAGRQIGVVEKEGVESSGMICSAAELGLGDDKEAIYLFPKDANLGVHLTEYFRVDGALTSDQLVVDVMGERTQGVAEILRKLEARDPELTALWEKTKKWSMDEFYKIYDWLDVRFDHYYYESDVGDRGKQICQEYYEKGVLVKSEGAIGADFNDGKTPFLLLIKSDGSGLYATKDIALAQDKFNKFGVDKSVYVVDRSQSLHFQQVFKTLDMMGYEKAKNCYHLGYGLVVLPDGKMGSRYGNVILFSELKESLIHRVLDVYQENFKGWPEEEIQNAAHRVAVSVIKYGMNNQDNLKDIVFDLKEWVSKTGNTGSYMLYAYARTRSILKNAGDYDATLTDWSLLTHAKEDELLNKMAKFPELVERACREYRPQLLCIYLHESCKIFNQFFESCPVLKAETEALKVTRLQLVDAFGRLVQKALHLLGIETLERM